MPSSNLDPRVLLTLVSPTMLNAPICANQLETVFLDEEALNKHTVQMVAQWLKRHQGSNQLLPGLVLADWPATPGLKMMV